MLVESIVGAVSTVINAFTKRSEQAKIRDISDRFLTELNLDVRGKRLSIAKETERQYNPDIVVKVGERVVAVEVGLTLFAADVLRFSVIVDRLDISNENIYAAYVSLTEVSEEIRKIARSVDIEVVQTGEDEEYFFWNANRFLKGTELSGESPPDPNE